MTTFAQKYTAIATQVDLYYGEMNESNLNLASMYALTNTAFSGVALMKKHEEVHTAVQPVLNVFATFKLEYLQPQFIAYFFTNKGNQISYEELKIRIQTLTKAGFPSNQSMLEAALLLTGGENHAQRSYALFKELKKRQPLLTNAMDLPMCVFIMQNEELNSKQIAETIEMYYEHLKKAFRRGNHLQLLAMVLAIFRPQYNAHAVSYVESIKAKLESEGIKVTRKSYVSLGILAMHEADVELMNEVNILYKELITTKYLKHNKAQALQLAVQKTVQDYTELSNRTLKNQQLPYLDNILLIVQFMHIIPVSLFLPDISFLQ
jgi:hypothetical protein